jgi:tRNA (cytosine49-C5)-methyltransferase
MLWQKYPEYFDKVLLDSPCSLEGRFDASDPKSYQDWSPKKVKLLSKMQKFLLRSAISLCKIGGEVVYSTCTLSPEENEEVIDWILSKEGGAVSVETISFKVPHEIPGLASWKGKLFNPEVQKSIRILPSKEMEGFFVVKLKKHKSTITHY